MGGFKLKDKIINYIRNNINKDKINILVVGKTGSGKSKLARELLNHFCDETFDMNLIDGAYSKEIIDQMNRSHAKVNIFIQQKEPIETYGLIVFNLTKAR